LLFIALTYCVSGVQVCIRTTAPTTPSVWHCGGDVLDRFSLNPAGESLATSAGWPAGDRG
jgi:hypothetical protein